MSEFRLTDKQKDFWNNANKRWNIKTGATRSGKTWLDYYIIPRRIRQRKGKEGIVLLLGNTQSTLWRNVIEPMQKQYGIKLVSNIKSNNQLELFSETCYALGADKISQVKKIQGASIKYCYGDEVATWSKEVFEMLKSRLDKPYSCFDGTLNPDSETHWFKKDFLDKSKDLDAFVQEYTIDDNPMLDKKFVEELKKEYLGTVYYDRFILGKWKNAEGRLFPQFSDNPSKWYIKEVPKVFYKVCMGVDIGGTKSHTTLSVTGIIGNYQHLVTFAEKKIKHEKGLVDTKRICDEICMLCKQIAMMGYVISFIFVDNAEQVILNSVRSATRNEGIIATVADCKKVDGKTRVLMYNLLFNTQRIWFYNCPVIVEALSTALYDSKSNEDKILDDFTTDVDSFDSHFYSWSYFAEYLFARR